MHTYTGTCKHTHVQKHALQAHSGGISLGAVQRCQLLDVFASMLPESARLAHEPSLLQRRHTRHMPPHILKQVRAQAGMLPCLLQQVRAWAYTAAQRALCLG